MSQPLNGSDEPHYDYGATKVDRKPSDVFDDSSDGESEYAQAGVKDIEAISMAWTAWSLAIAYFSVYLTANVTSLEGATTLVLKNFATDSFNQNNLLGTIGVVQSVLLSTVKPVMAKIADVFGRLEAFSISVLLFVIGYIIQATATNISTFAGGLVFYSSGSTGLQILQQIFVADTSNLLNRALFASIPDLPFLWTVWVGPYVASGIMSSSGSWRWGYGMWAIILPVSFLPLALSLVLNMRKAKKLGYNPPPKFRGKSPWAIVKDLWFGLDFFGLILLSATVALILIPLTLAQTAVGKWSNPSMIAMITIGCVLLPVFIFWERSKTLAPRAFFPPHLFKNRTVVAGVAIAFFYFMAFYMSVQPYFLNYLLVVVNEGTVSAGHVLNVFNFSSSATSIVVSFFIKFTGHYKYFISFGALIYLMGIGLMIKYRTLGTSTGSLVGTQIAVGIGGGMLNVPAQLGVQAAVSGHQDVAAATAIFLTILEIGGAVGNAVSGAIWNASLQSKLGRYLPADAQGQIASIIASATTASSYPIGTPEREAIMRAYQETMHTLLVVAVCICAPVFILSLFMKNFKLDQMDQKVKGRVVGGKADDDGTNEPTRGNSVTAAMDDAPEKFRTKVSRIFPSKNF